MSAIALRAIRRMLIAAVAAAAAAAGLPARAGTVVRFTTNLGVFDVDLFDASMPVTVANFLDYVTSDRYTSTIFHRSTTYDPFGIQIVEGGGFVLTDSQLLPVETSPPIPLEPSTANLRGTIAMARVADPDSATSQWYFNVSDNPGLDFNYAVFGSVIGTGLDVIDTIAAVPVYNASDPLGETFAELPLTEPTLDPQNFVLVDDVSIVAPWQVTIDVVTGTQTQAEAGYPIIATAGAVTKTGGGTLVFDAANAYTGPTTVADGAVEIANDGAVAGSVVTVEAGGTLAVTAGTVLRSPEVILAGGTLDAATLIVDATAGVGSLTIRSGSVTGEPAVSVTGGGVMALDPLSRITVAASSLLVDKAVGGGLLDLGAGEMVTAPGGSTVASLRADLVAGRNGGGWDGLTGITSSTAAASGGTRAVGYVVAGDGTARVSFAAAGDIDLSGQVNVFDLIGIDAAGKFGTGQTAIWSEGDFDYDGVANVFDLIGIDSSGAYGAGSYFPAAPAVTGGPLVAVPEPAVLAPLAGSAAGLLLRRLGRRGRLTRLPERPRGHAMRG